MDDGDLLNSTLPMSHTLQLPSRGVARVLASTLSTCMDVPFRGRPAPTVDDQAAMQRMHDAIHECLEKALQESDAADGQLLHLRVTSYEASLIVRSVDAVQTHLRPDATGFNCFIDDAVAFDVLRTAISRLRNA